MEKRILLLVMICFVITLTSCGPSEQAIATMTASAWTPTPQPTNIPLPTPTPVPDLNTEISTVEPAAAPLTLPGVTLIGKIAMDNAKSAQITLKVSADGKLIEGLGFSFTELKCEGFSAGSMSTQMTMREPVTNGKFEFSSSVGVISGQFTSPTAVQGSIHLKFNQEPIGEFECGTWDWNAKGN